MRLFLYLCIHYEYRRTNRQAADLARRVHRTGRKDSGLLPQVARRRRDGGRPGMVGLPAVAREGTQGHRPRRLSRLPEMAAGQRNIVAV